VEEVAGIVAGVIDEPRADVYTRPAYREQVAAYYTAGEITDVEARPPFTPAPLTKRGPG
jgi:hypothetical protein